MLHIVSFSGGKDSTCMLLKLLEKNLPVDIILFCDTGKEFPQMYRHIEKVQKYTGRKITRIKAKKTFDYLFTSETRKGNFGKHTGLGWMDYTCRWCTGELKKEPVRLFLKQFKKGSYIEYLGIASDESYRTKHNKEKTNLKYPLIDWNISEKQALDYCYSKGFDWEGLYEKFSRVSCYVCPLKRLNELKIIYNEFPDLWEDMRKLDKLSWRKFRPDYSLTELERKFDNENKQFEFNFF